MHPGPSCNLEKTRFQLAGLWDRGFESLNRITAASSPMHVHPLARPYSHARTVLPPPAPSLPPAGPQPRTPLLPWVLRAALLTALLRSGQHPEQFNPAPPFKPPSSMGEEPYRRHLRARAAAAPLPCDAHACVHTWAPLFFSSSSSSPLQVP